MTSASEPSQSLHRGKCISCGFLAKRTLGGFGHPPPTDYEATRPERRNTAYYFVRWENNMQRTVEFACFRDLADLSYQFRHEPDQVMRTTLIMNALEDDRQCTAWYPYKPGFSPARHFEWYQEEERERRREEFEKWMENGRQDFEQHLSKRQEDFETALATRNETLQKQRDSAAEISERVMKRLTVAALILAGAQVLTLTSDSFLARIVIWLWGSLRRLV